MNSLSVKDFRLDYTLECGQIFRYDKVDGYYFVSHRASLFKIKQIGNKLYYKNTSKKFLKSFFRIDDDYKNIIKNISKDNHIKRAIKSLYGLRIIKQDPWECLISYLCSSNSNIPKIKKNLNLISKCFGKRITLDGFESYTFPNPGELSHSKKLWSCKVGYRADFIKKVNRSINYSELKSLRKKSYGIAKNRLLQLPGVGDKIADCVLLFSLEKSNAFPVDVWIKRAMQELYFKSKNVSNKEIKEFGQSYFGEYAGYANQFLFYYRRTLK